MMTRSNRIDHIRITSHPAPGAKHDFPIDWGAASARERGPVIGTVSRPQDRNVIGTHGGSYSVYRALAVSSGALDPIRRPDLTNTHPAETIGPFLQWADPRRIVSLDPWGHLVAENFAKEIAEGIDIRPSIAITRARLDLPELQAARRVTAANAARAVVVAAPERPVRPTGCKGPAPGRLRNLIPNLLMALSGSAARIGAGRGRNTWSAVPGK